MAWNGVGYQLISARGERAGIGDSNMYNRAGGWTVLRAYSTSTAQKIADGADDALFNSNKIYYSQSSREVVFTKGFTAGSSMDCSSMGTYIVNKYGGGNMSQRTTSADFVTNALSTGLFMDAVTYTSGMVLYPGDILVNRYNGSGHVAIIGSGTTTQRVGSGDELLSDKFNGWSAEWGDYFSFGPSSGEFMPRLVEPIIEPVEAYLPDELIEAIELGAVTKEELEDYYDMYYIYEGRGGYSPFGEVPLTNASYAWNRFSEVLDMHGGCPLPQGSPGSWATNSGPFTVDMAPELGAIMCFSGPDGGYGCVVEMLLNEEVILTSQVEGGQFSLIERSKRYGMWDFDEYMFVGFVHNPAAYMGAEDESALETFLRIAQDQVGQGQSWVVSQTGIVGPNGWSGAFVAACSKRAGSSLNIVIPNVDSVSTIGRVGVLRGMGTWKKGSIYGGGYEPSAGDIAIFRYGHTGKENIYKGDKAAIVVESDGGSFEGVMGDDGDIVTKKSYSCSTPYIAGYFCPNWEMIDGTTASKKEYRNIQGLYTNGVTKYDACARTVCYMNSNYKPSIGTSKIQLAAVNYTGLLANFYSVFGQSAISTATNSELVVDFWTNTIKSYYQQYPEDFNGVSGEVVDLTGLISAGLYSSLQGGGWFETLETTANVSVTATVQECYEFFRRKGFNKAAAIGILANIQGESGFRTGAVGDSGSSVGLVQWHASRMTSMISWVSSRYPGTNWATNVTGQLEYIVHELDTNYTGVRDALKNVPNTAEGARQATAVWVTDYEKPRDTSGAIKTRTEYANGYYEQISGDGRVADKGGSVKKDIV